MKIERRISHNPLLEVINKKKYDILTKSPKVKELLDVLISLDLLKVNDKGEYYVYNHYNEDTKYPNIEKYIDWFAKIYKEGEINQEDPFEDLDTVESELKEFEFLKSRNIVPEEIKSKHISKFTYSDIKDITSQYSQRMTITQALKVDKSIKQEELPNVKSPFKVIKVTDPHTATVLASKPHLKWCVRQMSFAQNYLQESKGPLFFVYKNDEEFALLSFGGGAKGHGELMNPKDKRLNRIGMQEIKDHWSQVTEYLRVFNIHDFDVDFSDLTKKLDKLANENSDNPYPKTIIFKFSDIVKYKNSTIYNYVISNGEDKEVYDLLHFSAEDSLNNIEPSEFRKLFLAFLKKKLQNLFYYLEGQHKHKFTLTINKGVIEISFMYKDLFSYGHTSYKDKASSVDSLLDNKITDPNEIFSLRTEYTFKSIKEKLEGTKFIVSASVIEEFANAI